MEGMVQIRLKPWLRRAITRCAAIVPAAIVAGVGGNAAAGKLLVLSQARYLSISHVRIRFMPRESDLWLCFLSLALWSVSTGFTVLRDVCGKYNKGRQKNVNSM